MIDSIQKLIDISRYVGSIIPLWNQGFGGNISIKEDDLLYIKSTGKQLHKLQEKGDLAAVHWRKISDNVEELSEEGYKVLIHDSTIKNEDWGKPSMETGLHSSTSMKWVIHFHSVPMVLTSEKFISGEEVLIRNIFEQNELKVAFIPKVLPGLSLGRACAKIHPSVNVIILQCHGVIIRGENESILKKFESAEKEIIRTFKWKFDRIDTPLSPQKAYFPDTAVYWSEFLQHLIPVDENLFTLKEETPFYLREIWEAQHYLYDNLPEMSFFNEEEVSIISSLPTEQLRKRV